ncbi:hypothetical protein [Desertihabitans aurantiacus]|uniref:hypothetical protein n=1 Tax=Desertihabitans aurantiacus TaxID=2282477 RepID=UPI001300476F|nr:hypothetical protein [Desertihabitans aurantiacus]
MRRERYEQVLAAAAGTGGVVSRRVLRELGVQRGHIRHQVAHGRWHVAGTQTVVPHRGAVSVDGRRWAALWETGASIAVLDGVTALQVAGLRNFEDDDVHVSVVHRHDVRRLEGVRVHKVIRRVPGEVVEQGIPRTTPAVAALRAAYWARTDRQAALVLLMVVQQRLASPEQLLERSRQLRGRRRRAFVRDVVGYLTCGVESLGELDFARLCRQRGLPEPTRQVVVHGTGGRMYLDVRWEEHGLVVEVDGVQHREGLQVSADNLSRNEVSLGDDRVLRIDLVGLRLQPDRFLDQVRRGLRRGAPAGFEVRADARSSGITSNRRTEGGGESGWRDYPGGR